jgi:hypothetical protein
VEQTAKPEGGIVEVGARRDGCAKWPKEFASNSNGLIASFCLKSGIDNNTVGAAYTSHNDLTACAYNETTCTVTNRDMSNNDTVILEMVAF